MRLIEMLIRGSIGLGVQAYITKHYLYSYFTLKSFSVRNRKTEFYCADSALVRKHLYK